MLNDLKLFPLSLDAARIAGIALWSLALYLGFSPVSDRIVGQIYQWLNDAKGDSHTSKNEVGTSSQSQAQNTFLASLLSIFPFLVVGGLLNYGVELGLGRSWAISIGMIACVSCGVYELGRKDGQASG